MEHTSFFPVRFYGVIPVTRVISPTATDRFFSVTTPVDICFKVCVARISDDIFLYSVFLARLFV